MKFCWSYAKLFEKNIVPLINWHPVYIKHYTILIYTFWHIISNFPIKERKGDKYRIEFEISEKLKPKFEKKNSKMSWMLKNLWTVKLEKFKKLPNFDRSKPTLSVPSVDYVIFVTWRRCSKKNSKKIANCVQMVVDKKTYRSVGIRETNCCWKT